MRQGDVPEDGKDDECDQGYGKDVVERHRPLESEEVDVHHHGFQREQIQAWLAETGFLEINLETATVTSKEGKDYPVFLATARRG